jgi:hypothetical protein
MVVKNYLQQNDRHLDCKVCMQVLRPESIMHYNLSLGEEMIKND